MGYFGGNGLGGKREREEGERASLQHPFKVFFLQDILPIFSPEEQVHGHLGLCDQGLPSLLGWVNRRRLLFPHPAPASSCFLLVQLQDAQSITEPGTGQGLSGIQ